LLPRMPAQAVADLRSPGERALNGRRSGGNFALPPSALSRQEPTDRDSGRCHPMISPATRPRPRSGSIRSTIAATVTRRPTNLSSRPPAPGGGRCRSMTMPFRRRLSSMSPASQLRSIGRNFCTHPARPFRREHLVASGDHGPSTEIEGLPYRGGNARRLFVPPGDRAVLDACCNIVIAWCSGGMAEMDEMISTDYRVFFPFPSPPPRLRG